MTLDESDDEHKLEVLENESLPGTCKSSYALQFRMQTEADNANFANVSRSSTILLNLQMYKNREKKPSWKRPQLKEDSQSITRQMQARGSMIASGRKRQTSNRGKAQNVLKPQISPCLNAVENKKSSRTPL